MPLHRMKNWLSLQFGMVLVVSLVAGNPAHLAGYDDGPDFEADIAPLLIKRCLECHNEREAAGSLVLTTRTGLLEGGESGSAVDLEDLEESYLLERIASGEMPPEKKGQPQPLPKAEIEQFRAWIAGGADWPEGRTLDPYEMTTEVRGGRDWWSLQPIENPPVPAIQSVSSCVNPVDAFILARLEDAGMQPAPRANRRTLIRRLYFDLIGLPPTPEEVTAFANDESPQAYQRLVDRLLASPQFGERWGRYWLDLVRFAETCGYERDQTKPGVWRYRDWVVGSLNADKPYDRFVLEQLAGDELPDASEQTVIATGFLRLGTWNDEPNDPQEYKYERLEDMVHATSSAFLGMTVKCARCHDHKFDPILQQDYYRMASAFWAGTIEPGPRELLGGPTREQLGYDVFGWTDRDRNPPPLHLLKKGDPHRPGPVVEPGQLSMITSLDRPIEPPPEDAPTTRRRLQIARWLIDPDNPLTARVLVNRLWQHHFGAGLVRTPNNFGFAGEKPTHPQLLDWLAQQLLRADWRMKPVHRLIVTSRTYQQASLHPQQEEFDERDFTNRLWWKTNRRRLEAEALRDAMLVANKRLDTRMSGPSFKPEINPEALEGLSRKTAAWSPSPSHERNRRSLYIFSQRSLLVPLMTTFDFSDTTLPCAARDVTTVAPQALAMLNNRFVHQQSTALAELVRAEAGDDRRARVRQAWQLALGRTPTPAEHEAALTHLDEQHARFQAWIDATEPTQPFDVQPVSQDLVLDLRADRGVALDENDRVANWRDASRHGHHAGQNDPAARPRVQRGALGGQPAIRFSGDGDFLQLTGQVLTSQQFTIFAVVNNHATGSHREIFSNWDGAAGNSTSSIFLGTTGPGTIRLSDDFSGDEINTPHEHCLLTAVSSDHDAVVYRNGVELASKGATLAPRKLETPYVIGRQGSLAGEYWQGDVVEILVFDRALDESERRSVTGYLMQRYGLVPRTTPPDAEALALASLCHVLLNSNEFIYVD